MEGYEITYCETSLTWRTLTCALQIFVGATCCQPCSRLNRMVRTESKTKFGTGDRSRDPCIYKFRRRFGMPEVAGFDFSKRRCWRHSRRHGRVSLSMAQEAFGLIASGIDIERTETFQG